MYFGCEILEAGGREQLRDFDVHCIVPVHLRGERTKEAPNEQEGRTAVLAPTTAPPRPLASLVGAIKKMSQEQLSAKMERVGRTFVGVPINRNERLSYPYSFFALTDFLPALEPQLVEDMADICVYFGDFTRADVLVSEADRGGGPLIQAVAVRTNLRYVLANWYPSGEGIGATSDAQVGFSGEGRIIVNGVKAEDRCIFVDDMLSSGGTAEGVLRSLVLLGGIPVEGVFISEKLYPAQQPGGLPERKGKARLNSSFPHFKVTTAVQFIAEGDFTVAPQSRVGEY
jgi:adenine phosphoribosyltransferase